MEKSEIEECKRTFDLYDKNGDGVVSREELGDVMKSLGHTPTKAELEHMLSEIDINGDGCVDIEDFVTALNDRKRRQSECEQDLLEAFRVLDKNRDGVISASELHFVMMNLGEKLSNEEIEDMIREVDTDGDGHINYEEFVGMVYDERLPVAHHDDEINQHLTISDLI